MEIEIQEYKEQFPAFRDYDPKAAAIAQRLIDATTSRDSRLRVEHIGSSSVPGCAGKGYIDLLVIYPDGLLEAAKLVLSDLGFQRQQSRDPFPEDRPMRVGSVVVGEVRYPVHAHVVAASSPEVADLLWFRDRLRANPSLQREYEAEKRRILGGKVLDGIDYAEQKSTFV
ncbi:MULTISPECIES: GrpB family protein [Nostocales]|uniref:GrpB family protein n=2 Tax=Nostocales TaxID=1161 RepID=A0A8S9T4T5_9CYAN|nr:GrpB family protein [Tolypothrix bouteillei]KAF3886473.1 GrpB family protein [Tolypothrix bouteillei VB521301]